MNSVTYHCKIYSSIFEFAVEYVMNSTQLDTGVPHESLYFLPPTKITVIIS